MGAEVNRGGTIVIVDDEEMVLTSLSSYFALETDFEIVQFTSPNEALKYIESNDIDLVISDQMMPGMDGITFLTHVRKLKPEVPRYLLTGYADKENAIKAINNVALDKYIEKPWDNDRLRMLVVSGIEKRQTMKRLQQKIAEMNSMYQEIQELNSGLYGSTIS